MQTQPVLTDLAITTNSNSQYQYTTGDMLNNEKETNNRKFKQNVHEGSVLTNL